MPIKFGEIDANQILENEFRINVLRGSSEKCLLEMSVDWHFPRLRNREIRREWLTAPREIPEFRHHV